MEPVIRKLAIQTLKALVELRRLQSNAIAIEFNRAAIDEQKSELARQWQAAIDAKLAAQRSLDLLYQEEQE